jgi:hypothetical protein
MTSPRQLFLVAGYPASGKSVLLLGWLTGRWNPFGEQGPPIPVVPRSHNLAERSSAEQKIQAGVWCTLRDIPALSRRTSLPPALIFHLDLLLAYLRYEQPAAAIDPREVELAYARLFAEPLFAQVEQIDVTTLETPLAVIQERWKERRPKWEGSGERGNMMRRKDTMITGADALDTYAIILQGWHGWLSSMAGRGKLISSKTMTGEGEASNLQSSTLSRSQSSIAS